MADAADAPAAAAAAQKATKFQEGTGDKNHQRRYGLKISERHVLTKAVVTVQCRFCIAFGNEDHRDEQDQKKRKVTERPWCFTTFSTNCYKSHLTNKHPNRWDEYQGLTSVEQDTFFDGKTKFGRQQPLITNHFDSSAPVVLYIRRPVVDVLIGELLLADASEDEQGYRAKSLAWFDGDWDDDDTDDDEAVPVQYACATHYRVTIKEALQYSLVVKYVAAACTFRQVVEILLATKQETGLGKIGAPHESAVSKYVRIICALNFEMITSLLGKVWAFSLAFDMADHADHSYLDLRVRFGINGGIHDVHVMLIPVVGAHTGNNMSAHIMKVLDVICPSWKYKLIGTTSDGTSNNTGRFEGAVTYLQNAVLAACGAGAVASKFYRAWCVIHQLDLHVGKAYKELDGGQWLSQTQAISTHLRRAFTLIHEMKTHSPPVVITRWLAMDKLTAWNKLHKDKIVEHYNGFPLAARHHSHPSDKWWLLTYGISEVVHCVAKLVEGSQGTTLLLCHARTKLQAAVVELMTLVGMTVRDDDDMDAVDEVAEDDEYFYDADESIVLPDGQYTVKLGKVRKYLLEMGMTTIERIDSIAATDGGDEELKGIYRTLAVAMLSIVEGLNNVEPSRTQDNAPIFEDPAPCLPQELILMSGMQFNNLLSAHKVRLLGGQIIKDSEVDAEFQAFRRSIAWLHDDSRPHTMEQKMLKALPEVATFQQSWDVCGLGDRFPKLRAFAGGLACPYATTATVESDFSRTRREKSGFRENLQNFALEGCLQCAAHAQLNAIMNAL